MDTERIDKILAVFVIADGIMILTLEILFKLPVLFLPIFFHFL